MDDIARYNQERWVALTRVNALFTRPNLDLTPSTARGLVDPYGELGNLVGERVLLLAGGGGQQSAAFGILGAAVTVADLSPDQLERDQEIAAHYDLTITTVHADMRDLSMLDADAFDIVYQPYSINFVPDAAEVFVQVARVIVNGGIYRFFCANPYAAGITERDWTGDGYPVCRAYVQGERITYPDQGWVYDTDDLDANPVPPPVEYRHTLSHLINGLASNGFSLTRLREVTAINASPDADPGTWDHFTAILPPWLNFRAEYRPDDM